MRTAHPRQSTLDYGEYRLNWRMDEARKVIPVRLEPDLIEHAKKIGDGNLSLGIRRAIYRAVNGTEETAAAKQVTEPAGTNTEKKRRKPAKKDSRRAPKTTKPAKKRKGAWGAALKIKSKRAGRVVAKITKSGRVKPSRKRVRSS